MGLTLAIITVVYALRPTTVVITTRMKSIVVGYSKHRMIKYTRGVVPYITGYAKKR